MNKQSNTFLEYLQSDRFYDKIKNTVFSWCTGNKEILIKNIKRYNVSYIKDIDEDIDLDFINVWIDSKEGSRVEFDIAIDLSVEVEGVEGKYHDHDSYTSSFWIMVSCSGTLSKRLRDFYIIGIDEYIESKPKKPLDGDFKPYIRKSDYDAYANEILEKYYFTHHPEAKTQPLAINMEDLANRMGLTIQNTSISEDRSIFGQIFFADAEVDIFNSNKKIYEKKPINKNTVLVDTEAAYLRSYGSRNMTIAHECVHYYYHRKAFLFARMLNDDLHYIQCQTNGSMKNGEANMTAEWMEIQANGLASYILMPKDSFTAYARELFKFYNQSGSLITYSVKEIIDILAKTYEVTTYAARKRLIDLGFELAIGAYNWADGHYVKPYTFKKGFLSANETFTINYKDVYKKVLSSQAFLMSLYENRYVFVDNHLCLNDEKYIEKDQNGDLILSDYALYHMDECCVKFTLNSVKGFNSAPSLGLVCYLSRDLSNDFEFDVILSEKQELNLPETVDRYRIVFSKINDVLKDIAPLSFGAIIKYFMEYYDMSVLDLEVESGVSERMIRRYIKDEIKEPPTRTVVALLRALDLPPKITQVAIDKAGIKFRDNHESDDALYAVLTTMRKCSLKQCNDFLISLNQPPLSNEE